MRTQQRWLVEPPQGDHTLTPREVVEISAAIALLAAAVVFAFTFVPGQPYLMPATLPWIGVATHLMRLGHSRRTRAR